MGFTNVADTEIKSDPGGRVVPRCNGVTSARDVGAASMNCGVVASRSHSTEGTGGRDVAMIQVPDGNDIRLHHRHYGTVG